MNLNTFKNHFGLCACKGCFRIMSVELKVKEPIHNDSWGKLETKQKFFLCKKCVMKLF